jgi:hypothetical protein
MVEESKVEIVMSWIRQFRAVSFSSDLLPLAILLFEDPGVRYVSQPHRVNPLTGRTIGRMFVWPKRRSL